MSLPATFVYATALKKIFSDEKDFICFAEEVKNLKVIFQDEIFTFFCSPFISSDIKKRLLKNALQKASVLLLNFLCILIDKNQFHLWPDIVDQVEQEELKVKRIIVVEVESTTRLTRSTLQQIEKQLKRFFNKSLQLKEIISPKIIGGIKIRAGGMIFDDSISFHLSNIKKGSEIYGNTNQ